MGEQEFFLLLSPFITLVRNLDVGVLNFLSSPSNFSLGSRGQFFVCWFSAIFIRCISRQVDSSLFVFAKFNPQSVLNEVVSLPVVVFFSHPPTLFLLGTGVRNRVSFQLVRSLCSLSSMISTGVFSSRYSLVLPSSCLCFSRPPTLFFPEPESVSSINLICVEPLQSFVNCSNR